MRVASEGHSGHDKGNHEMTLKKLIAALGVVLITALGGISLSQSATQAIPAPNMAPASHDPGDGDNGIWP